MHVCAWPACLPACPRQPQPALLQHPLCVYPPTPLVPRSLELDDGYGNPDSTLCLKGLGAALPNLNRRATGCGGLRSTAAAISPVHGTDAWPPNLPSPWRRLCVTTAREVHVGSGTLGGCSSLVDLSLLCEPTFEEGVMLPASLTALHIHGPITLPQASKHALPSLTREGSPDMVTGLASAVSCGRHLH